MTLHRTLRWGRAAVLLAAPLLAGTAQAQDWSLAPTYGTGSLALGSGGSVTVDLEAGGDRTLGPAIGQNCFGIVANAPDYRMTISGSGNLDVTATSADDTTLLVRTPDGRFLCGDDEAGNFNPRVVATNATAGQYDIWVGVFETAGHYPPAQLTVSAPVGTGASTSTGTTSTTEATDVTETESTETETTEAVGASQYFFAEAGQPVGPVPLSEIEAAITAGRLARDTLVWHEGMAEWAAAESVAAIAELFPATPPPLPPGSATPPALPSNN